MTRLGETHVRGVYAVGKAVPNTIFYFDMKKCVMCLGTSEWNFGQARIEDKPKNC